MTTGAFHFDGPTHTYTLAGERLVSVTQALTAARMINFDGVPSDVLEQARIRGTHVHTALHYHLDGDLDQDSVAPEYKGYVGAGVRYLEESDSEVLDAERRDHHRIHKYAGTLDLRHLYQRKYLTITDWKTGEVLETAAFQLAAYASFFPNPRAIRRIAVKLNADRTYRAHEFPSPEYPHNTYDNDMRIFLSALKYAQSVGGRN